MTLADQQWNALLCALGQVPVADAAMNLTEREAVRLCDLALKGLEQYPVKRIGDGDREDALFFASTFNIDPETGLRQTKNQ